MSELMELLKEMDKEFGGGFELEDGVYFVTLDQINSKVWEKEGSEPAFILQWRVDSGPEAGKPIGDFLRWYVAPGADEKQRNGRRGSITSMVRGLTLAVDETRHPDIQNAYVELLHTETAEDAVEALSYLIRTFGEVRMPIRMVTSKTGYQNARYVERGTLITATDPREVAAIQV